MKSAFRPTFVAVVLGVCAMVASPSLTLAADRLPDLSTLLAIDDPGPPPGDNATTPSPQPPPTEDESPVFKKWWFWALTAAVVTGTVALGVWASKPTDQPARACAPNVSACFGAGR